MKTITLLLLLCAASFVSGQTPARALKIADGFADFEKDRLAEITGLYFSGDWENLQKKTIQLLQNLQFKPVDDSYRDEIQLDFRKHHYNVVFVYTAPDRKEDVLRFLVHIPSPEPYLMRIPGIKGGDEKKFYELFLSLSADDVLISTYLSTKEKSPLESQLPRFLKQFDPKLLENLLEAVASRNRIFAVFSKVDLPFSRASIQIEDVVQKGEKAVTQDFKLYNRPLTRFSFGIVSSLIVSSTESSTRANIQSGDLTKDPLRGHMPMGILNVHPFAYDSEAEKAGWNERFRFFIGGILAPEFGISAGAGIQVIRGFSINAGYGLLLIDTLKAGEIIGQEPQDPQDPFQYGTASVFFAGVGYNF